jgi:phosphoribosylamine--glycine ligase
VITGVPKDGDDTAVFHAGTNLVEGRLTVAGGRVLCVTALADSVRQAQQRAYQVAQGIHFEGMQYRTDIGFRAIKN